MEIVSINNWQEKYLECNLIIIIIKQVQLMCFRLDIDSFAFTISKIAG